MHIRSAGSGRSRLAPRPAIAIVLAALLLGRLAAAPACAQLAAPPSQATPSQAPPSQALAGLQEIAGNFYKAGAYDEALEFTQKALEKTIAEFGPEHERTGIQSYGAGIVAEAAGRNDLAETYYRQSVLIREKVYGADSPGTAQALEMLGGVMLRTRRLDEAERLFERVLKIRRDAVGREHSFNAGAEADLGAVSLARGDFDAALGYFREAVRLVTAQTTTQVVARSVIDAEIRRNRPAFTGLADAASRIRTRPGVDAAALLDEAFAASQQAWATSAASALAKMSARIGASDTDLGRRIRQLQDMAERILALHDEDMKAIATWSEVQRRDPTYTALLDEFRRISIERARVNAPVAAQQRVLVTRLTELATRCPQGARPAGQPTCADSDTERERIAKDLGALSMAVAQGAAETNALSQRMQAAEQILPGYRTFTSERTARLAEIAQLEQRHTAERAAVVQAFPDYVALTDAKPLTVAGVRALLQPEEALVSILVGSDRSFVWAISRTRVEWAAIDAGAEALAAHVAAVRRGLDPAAADIPDPGTSTTDGGGSAIVAAGFDIGRAHALYRLMLGPVAGVLAGKSHLIVVPTGPLSSLPFQVLVTDPPPVGSAGAEALTRTQWLIRRHALSVLPSVQSLAALRKLAPGGGAGRPFLGIGDPVLAGPAPNQQQRGAAKPSTNQASANQAKAGRQGPRPTASFYRNGNADLMSIRALAPLPETAVELTAIAKVLGAQRDAILLRETATETNVKAARLDQFRIIQFATHGLVSGELTGLAEPALVLTPPETPTALDDGLLTASEIAALRLDSDWVVLSACNTASGNEVGAEALSGLARAFFYAGARTLLVSHWAVQSEATVELTTATFATLARQPAIGRAEALRRTMSSMIDAGRPPSQWAPFVIVGEGGKGR